MQQLQGTEKQIKWAEEIRQRFAADADFIRAQFAKAPSPEARQKAEDALNAAMAQTNAHWWIERRTNTIKDLMREFYVR